MKVITFLVVSLFLANHSQNTESSIVTNNSDTNVTVEINKKLITPIYPSISGPTTVTIGYAYYWYGSPDESSCGSCQWTWEISPDGVVWTNADGPDSDNSMYWVVGSDFGGITDDDFYLRLIVTKNSTDYYSNAIVIVVNPQ